MNLLQKFFSVDYFFNPHPFEQGFLWGRPLAVLFTVILIIAFAILIRTLFPRMKRRAFYRGRAWTLVAFGATGYLLLWFRYQRAPYLSMRAILFVFFVIFGVYLVNIAAKALRERA